MTPYCALHKDILEANASIFARLRSRQEFHSSLDLPVRGGASLTRHGGPAAYIGFASGLRILGRREPKAPSNILRYMGHGVGEYAVPVTRGAGHPFHDRNSHGFLPKCTIPHGRDQFANGARLRITGLVDPWQAGEDALTIH
jgi:hypothetical protein